MTATAAITTTATTIPDDATYSVYVSLAAARVEELHALDEHFTSSVAPTGGRTYQRLPRHMQRRALSSTPKRLPRGLRARHCAEFEQPPRQGKRPRRCYRSRPRSLVTEYTRRQRRPGNTWLETHVWHAKRFHMWSQWGYALPRRPTQKMYRPTMRAVTERCTIQDQSFLCCLELRGPPAVLLQGLRRMLSTEGYACLTTPRCRMGLEWRTVTLSIRCPHGAVCDADILWLPSKAPDATSGQDGSGAEDCAAVDRMWLWIHPSSQGEVEQLLARVYDLREEGRHEGLQNTGGDAKSDANDVELRSSDDDDHDMETDTSEDEDINDRVHSTKEDKENYLHTNIRLKNNIGKDECSIKVARNTDVNLCPEASSLDDIPKSKIKRKFNLLVERLDKGDEADFSNLGTGVSLVSLKDTMNRFHLMGPETFNVLQRVFVPTTVEPFSNPPQRSVKPDCPNLTLNSDHPATSAVPSADCVLWWRDYYSSSTRREALEVNKVAWRTLVDAGGMADPVVLPLLVRDPRVMLPSKREKISNVRPQVHPAAATVVLPDSPLFDHRVRRSLLHCRRGDHEINELRHRLAVPGSHLPLDDSEARLPVLLLVRGSGDCSVVSSHVILPGGWGGNAWTALVHSGAVAAGTDHETHCLLEEHLPPPTYLVPDTPAGREYASRAANQRREEYFKMPPNKRPNYIKLGVQHPFEQPWHELVASVRRLSETNAEVRNIGTGFTNEVLTQLGMKTCENGGDAVRTVNGSNAGRVGTALDSICVMRNARYRKALDYLSCRSGNRRRVFRGISATSLGSDNKNELESEIPRQSPVEQRSITLPVDLDEVSDSLLMVQRTCRDQLLHVMVTLVGKGSVSACAMICLPTATDLQLLQRAVTCGGRPRIDWEQTIVHQPQDDCNQQERKRLKQQHDKDLARLHRLRKAARRQAREAFSRSQDVDTCPAPLQRRETLPASLKRAVDAVHDKHKDLMCRIHSYNTAASVLWLPPTCPLQQGARPIVGYVTEASFSRARGCGAGQGYVVTGPLIALWRHRLRQWTRNKESSAELTHERHLAKKRKIDEDSTTETLLVDAEEQLESSTGVFDVDLPLIQDNGIPVLIRNTNTLQYRFGMLTVCVKQPPP